MTRSADAQERLFAIFTDDDRLLRLFKLVLAPGIIQELRWDEGPDRWTDISPTLVGWLVEGRVEVREITPSELAISDADVARRVAREEARRREPI